MVERQPVVSEKRLYRNNGGCLTRIPACRSKRVREVVQCVRGLLTANQVRAPTTIDLSFSSSSDVRYRRLAFSTKWGMHRYRPASILADEHKAVCDNAHSR